VDPTEESSKRETFACVSHGTRQAGQSFHVKRAEHWGRSDIQAESMPRGAQYPQELHERAFRRVAEIGEAGAF
jgi:hypothetical protein